MSVDRQIDDRSLGKMGLVKNNIRDEYPTYRPTVKDIVDAERMVVGTSAFVFLIVMLGTQLPAWRENFDSKISLTPAPTRILTPLPTRTPYVSAFRK